MRLAALITGTVVLAGTCASAANARSHQRIRAGAEAAGMATVLTRAARVRDGVAPIGLACRVGRCEGTLELGGSRTQRGLYGAASFSLRAGERAVLNVRLTSAGRRLLRGNLSVLVSATVTSRGAKPAAAQKLTLSPITIVVNRWAQGFNKFWSGYALTGQKFTAVRGTFVQPSMSACSGSSVGSPTPPIANNVFIWSGLDGFGSSPIEQVGTEVTCAIPSGGEPGIGYFAWYETFPEVLNPIPVAIHAGDVIFTEVTAVSPQHFKMTLEDKTTGSRWSEVVYQHTHAPQRSAEWIDEAQGVSMPSISATDWSSVASSARGLTAPIGHLPHTEVTALAISGAAYDQHVQPSSLSGAGDAFSISWLPGA